MRRVAKHPHREEVAAVLRAAVETLGTVCTETKLYRTLARAFPEGKQHVRGWRTEFHEQKRKLIHQFRQHNARVRIVVSKSALDDSLLWLSIVCDWCYLARVQSTKGCMICAPKRDRLAAFVVQPAWIALTGHMFHGMPRQIAADALEESGLDSAISAEVANLLRGKV